MKTTRKVLAVLMCLCLAAVPFTAFAEGGESVNTTTTTTVDENGNTVVTVTVEKNFSGEEDGVDTQRTEVRTDTAVTDPDGNVLGETWTEDGTETKTWTEEDSGDAAGQPEVEVALTPGKTETGASEPVVEETGVPGEDYTETTTTERTVEATTGEVEVTVNDVTTGIVEDESMVLSGPTPVYDEDDDAVKRKDGRLDDAHGKDGLFDRNYLSVTAKYANPDNWDMPEGAEVRYVGTGEHSKYYAGFLKVVYEKDDEGNLILDENGEPIIKELLNSVDNPITINGEPATELLPGYKYDGFSGSRAQNFMLMDKDGNKVFAYCCDLVTDAVTGSYYSVSNLEDSDYYASEESEEHIRNIVLNGYWGTSDVPKEDGTYELGSLAGIKANLKAAVARGELDPYVPVYDYNEAVDGKYVLDENGEPVVVGMVNILDIIDGMTEGEALLATQAAVWSFANGTIDNPTAIDGGVVVTPDWYRNHQTNYSSHEKEPLSPEAGSRVTFLYNWLMGLEDTEDSTVIINDKNFVEDMTLVVGDKIAERQGVDADGNEVTNGIYNTELNFKLAFLPAEGDDLLLQITYNDLDGNPVQLVKRLAGANGEGQDYDTIVPDENGNYIISGLQLSENEDFDFDLRLEGTQHLDHGVYVYAPVGGREVSQTFVGIAEGTRDVDVSVGVTIRFEVDENDTVVAQRSWHAEGDPIYTPDGGDEDPVPGDEEPVPTPEPPVYDSVQPYSGGYEIPDEEVPLADVPATGDSSWMLIVAAALAAAGIAVTFVLGKKKEAC